MIKKATSKQLMDILEQSSDKIQQIRSDMSSMKVTLDKRLQIVRNIEEYLAQETSIISDTIAEGIQKEANNRIVFASANIVDGNYDIFGTTIHPQIIGKPTNVFNFETSTGAAFKDNCSVKINGEADAEYRALLMHDSIPGQAMAFKEFDSPTVTLDIKLNPAQLLGPTAFNMMELVPFIPGSFDITSIRIWSQQDRMLGETKETSRIITELKKVGACRIMTDNRYNLYECRITFRLNFKNSNGRYPFGIRHLYFLNTNLNPQSYCIVKLTQNKFLDSIGDDIKLRRQSKFYDTISEKVKVADQTGYVSSTCKDEGVQLYMDYASGALADPISTTKGFTENSIAQDIRTMYVKVPIIRSTISLSFDKIKLR